VRFVDDDERLEDMAEVDERMDGLSPVGAFGAEFEPCHAIEGREVTLPPFRMSVDGSGFRVFGLESLDSRNHDDESRRKVLGTYRFESIPRDHEGAAPGFDELLTIGMPGSLKSCECLFEDGLRGDEP